VLVTVASGYADGLVRALGRNGRVSIAGHKVPFAGRISMDLITLDATDVPAAELTRGAEVEFLGEHISLEDAARAAGTINHEILAGLHPRATRVYVED
jgi:alanine racemase